MSEPHTTPSQTSPPQSSSPQSFVNLEHAADYLAKQLKRPGQTDSEALKKCIKRLTPRADVK
jgi:hypothetical protein